MNTLFWNVDTQYDFMRNDDYAGKLFVKDAHLIEPQLARLTALAEELDIKVINTADSHDQNSAELSNAPNYITTFPPHCMKDTKGAQYVPATAPKNPYVIDWRQKDFSTEKLTQHRD